VTGETVLTLVRYGNELFFRGSVIPLFIKQIKENNAISVTEPEMTRFLLPLKEAIDLVSFALEKVGREIFLCVRHLPV
jgi:UDP-N-acetylglucosamine 4,6-dehydratase/5-epimerase